MRLGFMIDKVCAWLCTCFPSSISKDFL